MSDVKDALRAAFARAVARLGAPGDALPVPDIPVQEVPEDKPGDYGTPVAFALAKTLRRNPADLAAELVAAFEPPAGVLRAEAVGPYINVVLDPATFLAGVVDGPAPAPARGRKVVVEHTSVNPNKEAHVGHLRNVVLGDAVARILRADGYDVEVQNYVDDTGRQAAESLFAAAYFGETPPDPHAPHAPDAPRAAWKLDHWYGERYVRLGRAKEADGDAIEAGVADVMHALERGERRDAVERIVAAQLATFHALGATYDLLVWESDVVAAGFLARGLEVLEASPYVERPEDGKYAGALVMRVGDFLPGLEEDRVVLVRSDGNAMYVAKDVGYQFWKAGLFEGLRYAPFAEGPGGATLWTSHPAGTTDADGRTFAHAASIVNVIDVRQTHPQTLVKAALALSGTPEGEAAARHSHHLAYEVVTLEGEAMSGRKGTTLALDDAMDEAVRRAGAVVAEKNPDLTDADAVARAVGLGALRFAMLKSEAKRIIDFRWERALDLQGDTAPYVQYAHARAASILRAARDAGLDPDAAPDPGVYAHAGPLEVALARRVAQYPEVRAQAAEALAPHLVAQYALDLATAWNGYYNHRGPDGAPDTAVLRAEPGLREARLALVGRVRTTLAEALALLGIEAPEAM
ncbi:MAG: arginine--tRNA ligase [Trueperaceae bacterium]|nr:arginine--tRNA ligase [Trueperaceae bacterium]